MAAQPAGSDWRSNKPDPLHPPKYCPQCAWGGKKSKVKKFKMIPESQEWVIMCKNEKCPWPFSVLSPAEATVKSEALHGITTGKKRKMEDEISDYYTARNEKKVKTFKVTGEEEVTNSNCEDVGQPEENAKVKSVLYQNIGSVKWSSADSSEVLVEWSNRGDSATFQGAISENDHVEKTVDFTTLVENCIGSRRFKSKKRKSHLRKLNNNTRGFQVKNKSSVEGHHHPVQDYFKSTSEMNKSFLVKVDNLPSGVLPSPPPSKGPLSSAQLRVTQSLHSRLVSAPSWSSDDIRRLSAIASPPALTRLPVSDSSRSSSLVDVVTSTETARSLFDIDGPGVAVEEEFVYLGSIDTGESGSGLSDKLVELIDEATVNLVKPVHTYKRVQRKQNVIFNPIMNNLVDEHNSSGLDLENASCANVNLARPHNLPTSTLDMDVDFATAKKLGSGVTMDMELREMFDAETLEDITSPGDSEGNYLVFHVAKETMTTQPTVLDNFVVKEQGSTRVFLTTGSDQVELTELRKEGEGCIKYGRGRKGGRKRRKKEDSGEEVGKQRWSRTCDKGWFMWRDWKIDEKFLLDFTAFLDSLLRKWDPPKNLEIDSRIRALLMEKEVEREHPETINKKISFFASVYVKYIYIMASYPSLSMDVLMKILQKNHRLENQQFVLKTHSLMKQNQLSSHEELARNNSHIEITRDVTSENKELEPVFDAVIEESSHVDSTEASSSESNSSLVLVQHPEVLLHSSPLASSEQSSFLVEVTLSQPPSSVHSDNLCSVQVDSAPPYTLHDDIGQGTKLVQFFYNSQETDTSMAFPPVRVNTDEEVKYVVALVTEMAEEYNMKHNVKQGVKPQILYSIEAAMARSVLDTKLVKHIKKCFTKNGMKALKTKRQKTVKNWTKKNIIVKAPRRRQCRRANDELGNVDGNFNKTEKIIDDLANNNSNEANGTLSKEVEEALLDEIVLSLNEEVDKIVVDEGEVTTVKEVNKILEEEVDNIPNEEVSMVEVQEYEDGRINKTSNETEDPHMENVEEVEKIEAQVEDFIIVQLDESAEEEHVPTTEELRLELELKLFGGHLPKVVHQVKAPRGGTSDRKGRGGRNEFGKTIASESVKLGAVEYILACKQCGDQEPVPAPDFNLSALCRKKISRKKIIDIDFDDISDEDDEDYKAPSIYKRKYDLLDGENRRKSERLSKRQARVDSGEYFVAENHDFDNTLGYFWQDHHQPRYRISEDNLSSKAVDQSSDPDSPDESLADSQDDVPGMTLPEPSPSSALQQVGKDASVKICNPSSVDEWVAGKTISKVNENYIRSSKKSAKMGVFEQVFTRNRNCRKVRKLFRQYKMQGNQSMRKYKGLKQKKPRMVRVAGKVSQEERNLMKELLEIATSACVASNPTSATDVSLCSDASLETMREFEELQTLAVDVDDASAEVDTMLQLNC